MNYYKNQQTLNNFKKMKKIFISHSTLDKDVIDTFIDKILVLGMNLEIKDIACTSREDTGVKSGEDIRDFIKENITNCDYVLFMISDNYKNSEICLNEMGAAWATNKNVKPIIFPNIGFNSIGWLYNIKRGIMLDDSAALDSLYEEISEICEIKSRTSTWNKQKTEFLDFLNKKYKQKTLNAPVILCEEEGLDLLDCRERFDSNTEICMKSLDAITAGLKRNIEYTNKATKMLTNIRENKNISFSQARSILLKLAHENNILGDIYEQETLIIEDSFSKAIEFSIKMRESTQLEDEDITQERESIKSLIVGMEDFIDATRECKDIMLRDENNLDKTHTKSKKRLIDGFTGLINSLQKNIDKANELLIYT